MVRSGRLKPKRLREISVHNMLSTIFFSYAIFLCSSPLCCFARDTITMNSLLSDDEVEKILFQQAKKEKRKGFELGFFTLEENPVYRSYVGIGIRPLYIFYLMNPNIYKYIYTVAGMMSHVPIGNWFYMNRSSTYSPIEKINFFYLKIFYDFITIKLHRNQQNSPITLRLL